MRRILFIISGVVLLAWSGLSRPPVIAQSRKAQATIDALQTRVAELEQQLGITPTPAVQTAPGSPSSGLRMPRLFGGAPAPLPQGTAGIVDVVAVGPPSDSSLPIALRNNTGEDVYVVDVLALARDTRGTLVASGESSFIAPVFLPRGRIAIGSIYFGSNDIPPGVTFAFEPEVRPVDSDPFWLQDVDVTEATLQGNEIVGLIQNPTDSELSGSFFVVGVCFDASGAITAEFSASAAKDTLRPGESSPFSASLYSVEHCDYFLMGAWGRRDS